MKMEIFTSRTRLLHSIMTIFWDDVKKHKRSANVWKCYCFIPIIIGIHFKPKYRWISLIVSTLAAIYPLPYKRLTNKQVPNRLTGVVHTQAVMLAKQLKHSITWIVFPTNLYMSFFLSFVPGDPWDVRLRWAKSRGGFIQVTSINKE